MRERGRDSSLGDRRGGLGRAPRGGRRASRRGSPPTRPRPRHREQLAGARDLPTSCSATSGARIAAVRRVGVGDAHLARVHRSAASIVAAAAELAAQAEDLELGDPRAAIAAAAAELAAQAADLEIELADPRAAIAAAAELGNQAEDLELNSPTSAPRSPPRWSSPTSAPPQPGSATSAPLSLMVTEHELDRARCQLRESEEQRREDLR